MGAVYMSSPDHPVPKHLSFNNPNQILPVYNGFNSLFGDGHSLLSASLTVIGDNETGCGLNYREFNSLVPVTSKLLNYITAMAYDSRKARMLGNRKGPTSPDSDGVVFRGWSLCHITGRSNSVRACQVIMASPDLYNRIQPVLRSIIRRIADDSVVSDNAMNTLCTDDITMVVATLAHCSLYKDTVRLRTIADIVTQLSNRLSDNNLALIKYIGYPADSTFTTTLGEMRDRLLWVHSSSAFEGISQGGGSHSLKALSNFIKNH